MEQKKVVEWLKEKNIKIDFCLVGEPTNPQRLGEMIKNWKKRKFKWNNNCCR